MVIDGKEFPSRLFLGSARYPSPMILQSAIRKARPALVTVSLRRQSPESGGGAAFWDAIRETGVPILPNTAGCRSAREAIAVARMARELFSTHWIKLEVTGEERFLQPDPFELVEAARALNAEGFTVFPYMTEDLIVAERLVAAGCRILMPWGSPIGSGRGIVNPIAIRALRANFPGSLLVLDAGIGRPSHAAQALELGCDAVLVNTAVALSDDPVAMAEAFAAATTAGRLAYEAGMMIERELATPSTPEVGKPFWSEMR